MANEITVTASLGFVKSSSSDSLAPDPLSVTFTGTQWIHNRQSVGTSEEALVLGEVVTGGWLLIINRDSTNYVQYKSATGVTAGVRILAGECALFRTDSGAAAPFVQANTAACQIEYLLLAN